jgi:hypothetical protein
MALFFCYTDFILTARNLPFFIPAYVTGNDFIRSFTFSLKQAKRNLLFILYLLAIDVLLPYSFDSV